MARLTDEQCHESCRSNRPKSLNKDERLGRKQAELLPLLAADQCRHFLPKKMRFCKFQAVPGKTTCTHHGGLDRKRVLCPYDANQYAAGAPSLLRLADHQVSIDADGSGCMHTPACVLRFYYTQHHVFMKIFNYDAATAMRATCKSTLRGAQHGLCLKSGSKALGTSPMSMLAMFTRQTAQCTLSQTTHCS